MIKSFTELLAEEAKRYNNWKQMDTAALRHEYDIEYTIKPLKSMSGDAWPSFADFQKSYKTAKVVTLTKADDRRIEYRSGTKTRSQLINLIKGYASYPQFRNEKTIDSIFSGFENNEAMNMPIVLEFEDGRRRIMGGNTRLDIAFMLGINPKVTVVKVPSAKSEGVDHFGEMELSESFNNVQEYFMTDDTNPVAGQIYANFMVDKDEYNVSLVRSGKSNIFICEVKRVINKNGKLWSFRKSSHIRPVIATTIQILQSSLPFMVGMVKGIAFPVPQKVMGPRFNTMMKFVMKKTFNTQYKSVDIQHNEGWTNGKSYMFLVKNGMNAASVFKTKAWAGFDFDKEGIPEEAMAEITPAKKQPIKLSSEPSKKYQYQGFDVDTTDIESISSGLKEKEDIPTDNAEEEKQKKVKKIKDQVGIHQDEFYNELTKLDTKFNAMSPNQWVNMDKDGFTADTGHIHMAAVISVLFSQMTDKLIQYGFDESKVNWGDMQYRVNEELAKHTNLKLNPKLSVLWDKEGVIGPVHQDSWKIVMKHIANITDRHSVEATANKFLKDVNEINSKMKSIADKITPLENEIAGINEPKETTGNHGIVDHKIADHNLSLPSPKDMEPLKFDPTNGNRFMFTTHVDNTFQKVQDRLMHESGYAAAFGKMSMSDDPAIKQSFKDLYDYTGPSSGVMNSVLRNHYKTVMTGDKVEFENGWKDSAQKSASAARIFDHVKPLTESVWVYRNADIPNVEEYVIGDDIIDPGFMSTSLRNTISIGDGGNSRLTIYIPKGSVVMPMLSSSAHPSENEIVLPPLSVIRPLEIVRQKGYKHRFHMKCVLIGTGYKDFIKRFEKASGLSEETQNRKAFYMSEAKKPTKTDNSKWGSMPSATEMKQIQKDIEAGKLKVETPKK